MLYHYNFADVHNHEIRKYNIKIMSVLAACFRQLISTQTYQHLYLPFDLFHNVRHIFMTFVTEYMSKEELLKGGKSPLCLQSIVIQLPIPFSYFYSTVVIINRYIHTSLMGLGRF